MKKKSGGETVIAGGFVRGVEKIEDEVKQFKGEDENSPSANGMDSSHDVSIDSNADNEDDGDSR